MRISIILTMLLVLAVGLWGAARFNDNGDGTVTDNGTGLVWQKCTGGQSASDCSGTATDMNWQGALQYCRNLTLAGRNWRLPSINELKSIVDYSVYNPAINTFFFPNTEAYDYWSSSTDVNNAVLAWYVFFYDGLVNVEDKTANYYYVRCVADGP
jgi:hypothetical protein